MLFSEQFGQVMPALHLHVAGAWGPMFLASLHQAGELDRHHCLGCSLRNCVAWIER